MDSQGVPDNDVGVWHLATAIPTSSTIGYATLPAQGSDPASGTTLTVAGWYVYPSPFLNKTDTDYDAGELLARTPTLSLPP